MSIKYNVETTKFAEQHYIKRFRKKYKTNWDSTLEIKVLLVYHKSDIGDKNETATWKKIIRDNFDGYDFCK